MPKIKVKGIDKKVLVKNVFQYLTSNTPGLKMPEENVMHYIASNDWGFDLSDSNEELDDSVFVSKTNASGLIQAIADKMYSELPVMEPAAKKIRLDRPTVSASAPTSAPATNSNMNQKPVEAAQNLSSLTSEQKQAEEKAIWQAARQREEEERQAADIENARRARLEIEHRAKEEVRLEAERKALDAAKKQHSPMDLSGIDTHREVKRVSEITRIASRESFDQYRNELLRNWLVEHKFSKKIEGIYLTKQSKLVNILGRTPEVTGAIYNQLVKDLQGILKRQGVNAEELSPVVYPPKVLEYLYGFRIPFEKNAFSNDNGTTPVFQNGRIAGKNIEVKIPYLRIGDTKKLVWYIIQRLEKGITEDSLKEDVPSLDELLPTLQAVPTDAATQQLIKSYEGLVRFQESIQAPGYGRVLFDDFETFAKLIGSRIKPFELAKFVVENILPQTRTGVSVNESELCELLAKLYGETPRIKTANPERVVASAVSVPVELNAPKLPHAKSHTTLLIDVSSSMGDGWSGGSIGRLTYLKKALIETVTLLAKKPGQTLTVVTFESSIATILKGQLLNEDTLPGIVQALNALTAGGGTEAQPALELAFEAIEAGVNQKIILGTDGEFSLNKQRLAEILRKKGVMAPSIGVFAIDYSESGPNVKNLEDIAGLGTEGSQLIFTKREEMDKTVKNLILDKANRAINTLTVTIGTQGVRPQSIVLTPCLANKVINRFVDVPLAMAEHAVRQSSGLSLTFNFVYDDKSTHSTSVLVSPLELMSAYQTPASVRTQRDYINEWYNHELYKRGIVQTNQLNLYSLEEQLKLLSDVQAAAKTEQLQHDFVPDCMMFVLGKWYKIKQAELEGYQYQNNPTVKMEKLKANMEEAIKYGFHSLAYAFKNEMQTLEESIWVDRRVAELVKIAFDLSVTSEAEWDRHRETDAGMREDIYRRILLEAQTQGKNQEIITRLRSKISENWLQAQLIERADADHEDSFENLSIEQQLGIIIKLRVASESDPLATEEQRKVLAQMWINRTLAVNVAELTRDVALLAKPQVPVKAAVESAPVVEPVVRHHRFRRRRMPAPVVAPVAAPVVKGQEAVTRIAQAMLKLSFEQHQEVLTRLKAAATKLGDKRALDLINAMTDDQKKEQEVARAQGTSWSPKVDDIVVPVPKRVEQTFNTVDAGGNQNAVVRCRYRRGRTAAVAQAEQKVAVEARAARAQQGQAAQGERNLLGLLVLVAPISAPAPMLLSGGPATFGFGLNASVAPTTQQLEQDRLAQEQAKAFAMF